MNNDTLAMARVVAGVSTFREEGAGLRIVFEEAFCQDAQ